MNLQMVSYNIHMGLDPEALVKNIHDFALQGVKIFCLQEFWKWMQPKDLEQLLLKTLGPEWQMEYQSPDKPYHDYGACMLWNTLTLQASSFERLALPLKTKTKFWEKVWIRVHGFGSEAYMVQRGALVGTFSWEGRTIRIINVHLDWAGGDNQRTRQLLYIKNYLSSQPKADHEVMCGDFNTIGIFNRAKHSKEIVKIIESGFTDACQSPQITCPPFILDYILVKDLKVAAFQVHKLPGSDHFPVFAELTV